MESIDRSEIMILDHNAIQEEYGEIMDTFSEGIRIFAGEFPIYLEDLRLAIEEKDGGAMSDTAHTLKGALSSIFAVKASELAFQIEQYFSLDQTKEIYEVYTELVESINELMSELEEFTKDKIAA